jgi:hypothetical protein
MRLEESEGRGADIRRHHIMEGLIIDREHGDESALCISDGRIAVSIVALQVRRCPTL